MNKKGELMQVIYVFGTIILFVSFIFMLSLGAPIVKNTWGTITDSVSGIGTINGANFTNITGQVTSPITNIINNYHIWLAIIYIAGIILIFSLAFVFRGNVGGWNISLFLFVSILIIIVCIVMSNTYENFYSTSGYISDGMSDAGIVNYLILYMPTIMTIVCFFAGVVMMSGGNRYE
jgi:hypothetical protein